MLNLLVDKRVAEYFTIESTSNFGRDSDHYIEERGYLQFSRLTFLNFADAVNYKETQLNHRHKDVEGGCGWRIVEHKTRRDFVETEHMKLTEVFELHQKRYHYL